MFLRMGGDVSGTLLILLLMSFLTAKARQGLRKKQDNFTPVISTGATFYFRHAQKISTV